MRTLSAELLAEQQAASNTPYIAVTIGAYKYDNDGQATYTNRILAMHRWEEAYGGGLEIWLDNADKGLNAINFIGSAVTLLRGFKSSGGTYYTSQTQPYTVILQRDDSIHDTEPQLVVHLTCADNWYKLAKDSLIAAGVKVTATNSSSITEGTGWVKGEVITGTPSGATGNLVAVGLNFIVLVNCEASDFTGDTSFAGASGSISSVSGITDQSAAGGGEYKGSAIATYPANTGIINLITSGIITDVVIDSDDPDGQLASTPYVPVALGESVRGLLFRALQMTRCGARIDKDNSLRLFYLDPAGSATYTYSTTHIYWSTARERALLIPNTVDFVESAPDVNSVPTYFGTANDAASVALIGSYLFPLQVNPSVSSDAVAVIFATAFIARKVAQSFQGYISTPINVGQEVYDMVSVVDARSGLTVTARIGRLEEWYNGDVMGPARYETQLRLGSLMSELGELGFGDDYTSDLQDVVSPSAEPTASLSDSILPYQLGKALMPYTLDIAFTAVDQDDISWAAGTITFADKTTQSILLGTLNLANANPYYLYCVIGNTTLQSTQTFGTAVGPDRVLVGFAVKGVNAGTDALIIIGTQGPKLFVDHLSAITANMGLLTAGEIRVGSGTVGVDFTGFRLDTDYIAGYNADVLQAYIASADGKLYAGAGAVIIDATGILVKETGSGSYLGLYWNGAGTKGTVGNVRARAANEFSITSASGTIDLILEVAGTGRIGCIGVLEPYTDLGYDLGSTGVGGHAWHTLYVDEILMVGNHDIEMNSRWITGMSDPLLDQDAATKKYVDDVAAGLPGGHDRLHAITDALDHSSTATSGKMLKADANGLPVDATNTDTDVADAVTKKHSQNTDTLFAAMPCVIDRTAMTKGTVYQNTTGYVLILYAWLNFPTSSGQQEATIFISPDTTPPDDIVAKGTKDNEGGRLTLMAAIPTGYYYEIDADALVTLSCTTRVYIGDTT